MQEVDGPTSHTSIIVSGLDDAAVTTAVGRYLVGVIGVGRNDVRAAVEAAVGSTNVFQSLNEIRFRDRVRNAWIAEGVAHALLVVRSRVETCCLAGQVRATSKPHDLPSMPGLRRCCRVRG